ncbi:DNA-binding protein [Rhodococcus sp. B10]|nr:DNA-binding protein [Rhodococcus sp. B10]
MRPWLFVTESEPVNVTGVSTIPYAADVLDPSESLLQLTDVSKVLGVPISRVEQMLRDRHLIAVKRSRVPGVPEVFLDTEGGNVVKGLPGLLAVLHDGGYQDDEILRWLFESDDSLPGRPVDAMHGHLMREVIRRAQAMAF